MKRPRASTLVTGTLAGILGLVGGYFGHDLISPPVGPNPVALQQDIEQLTQRNKDLEDDNDAYFISDLISDSYFNSEINDKEDEIQGLKEKKSNLERKVSELRILNDEQDVRFNDLTTKDSKLYAKLKSLYVNSVLNENYPAEAIEHLMDEAKVSYDKTKFEIAIANFSSLKRQGLFMALLDKGQLYLSYDQRKKDRHFEFSRTGIADKIVKDLGIEVDSSIERDSSLSYAAFEVYEASKAAVTRLPPVR